MKPYELHQSCRTNDLFSFSISYRVVHAIFRFLHYLDDWQWDCQWIIMNLQGVCNGAFPTSVYHGKLGTSSQSWWAPILLPTQIPTGLKFMIQEFSWVCNQNKRIWVGLLLYTRHGCGQIPKNIYHTFRSKTTIFSVTCFWLL